MFCPAQYQAAIGDNDSCAIGSSTPVAMRWQRVAGFDRAFCGDVVLAGAGYMESLPSLQSGIFVHAGTVAAYSYWHECRAISCSAFAWHGGKLFFAAYAVWSVWVVARTKNNDGLLQSVVITATFIAVPHIMNYDMTASILVALYLLKHVMAGEELGGERLALAVLLVCQSIAIGLPEIPVIFAAMLGCHLLLMRRVFLISRRPS
jgi:hypothetical protein